MNDNTRRDALATGCTEDELERRLPLTVGEMRAELIRRGIIPVARKHGDVLRSYTDADTHKLRCLIRYEYADEMIAASR